MAKESRQNRLYGRTTLPERSRGIKSWPEDERPRDKLSDDFMAGLDELVRKT